MSKPLSEQEVVDRLRDLLPVGERWHTTQDPAEGRVRVFVQDSEVPLLSWSTRTQNLFLTIHRPDGSDGGYRRGYRLDEIDLAVRHCLEMYATPEELEELGNPLVAAMRRMEENLSAILDREEASEQTYRARIKNLEQELVDLQFTGYCEGVDAEEELNASRIAHSVSNKHNYALQEKVDTLAREHDDLVSEIEALEYAFEENGGRRITELELALNAEKGRVGRLRLEREMIKSRLRAERNSVSDLTAACERQRSLSNQARELMTTTQGELEDLQNEFDEMEEDNVALRTDIAVLEEAADKADALLKEERLLNQGLRALLDSDENSDKMDVYRKVSCGFEKQISRLTKTLCEVRYVSEERRKVLLAREGKMKQLGEKCAAAEESIRVTAADLTDTRARELALLEEMKKLKATAPITGISEWTTVCREKRQTKYGHLGNRQIGDSYQESTITEQMHRPDGTTLVRVTVMHGPRTLQQSLAVVPWRP